jgi:hypothetical protein
MPCVWTDYLDEQLLVDATASVTAGDFTGVLNPAKIVLISANFVPSNSLLYSALTIPTYPGYAAQAAVFGSPRRRREGGIAIDSAALNFAMTDATMPTAIWGYGVTDGQTVPKLLTSELFPNGPLNLVDTLDIITLIAQIATSGPDAGTVVVSN